MKNCLYWLILVIFISSCQSKDGDYSLFSPADDLNLGRQIIASIESDNQAFPLLQKTEYPELYKHLERISSSILESDAILHRDEFAWELRVINNDTVFNAFCTPGGFIFIYTGLIKYVKTEDELAGVIAHEIAHGDRRHSTDQLTKAYGVRVIAGLLTGGDAESITNIGINLLGLQFSRNDEREADKFAVSYLSDTDYNPLHFANFFLRMQSDDKTQAGLQFLNTHPNPANRVENIKKYHLDEGGKTGSDHSGNFRLLINSLP